jgi:hypothetical protein
MLIKGRRKREPSTQTVADVAGAALGYDQPIDAVSVFGRLLQTLPSALPAGLHDTSLTETIENAAQAATREKINQAEGSAAAAAAPDLTPPEPGTLPPPEPEGDQSPPGQTAPGASAQGGVSEERVEAAVQAGAGTGPDRRAENAASALPTLTQSPALVDGISKSVRTATEDAVTEAVARNTTMTAEAARPLVKKALADGEADGIAGQVAKVQDAVKAVTIPDASLDVELSGPVMLSPADRQEAAIGLLVALFGCIVGMILLGAEGKGWKAPGAAYVALAVTGVLAIIGVLVIVMGYKNVAIKLGRGGSGTGGTRNSGTSGGADAGKS